MLIGFGADGYNPQYNIYNFIGDNIYPNIIPQNIGLPALCYRIEKNDPDKIKELRAPNNRVSIEIDIMDKSYAVVNQLSTLVINQLHRYTNSFNSNDSDSIGYGTTEGDNKYGRFAPASTGDVQYVGGLQIQFLEFMSSTETYEEKLEVYKNTLLFDMLYIDDLTIWGADVVLKFDDLNLMATISPSPYDPVYTQPIEINQGANYLFTPSVLNVDNNKISSTTLDGIYENFYGLPAPIIKKDALNPPKYNEQNYLEFASSRYMLSSQATNRKNRKYKEITFFVVCSIPDSYSNDKGVAILGKRNSTTDAVCSIFFNTITTAISCKFVMGGTALEEDGAGGEEIRGFNFQASWVSIPSWGLMPNVSMEDPFYFAVSFKRKDGEATKLEGQYEWITSSDFSSSGFGDKNNYYSWSDTSSSANKDFKEYFFNFETIHSDISSYDTKGAGTIALNDACNIYDFVMWPESLIFGTNKYTQVKREIISKHNMFNRTTN